MNEEVYDADYFLRGQETGKSLYSDYRWLPDLTIPMVQKIVDHLGIDIINDVVLDYGCSRGYVVKALRILGYKAYGLDVSRWAIENCDPEVRSYVGTTWDITAHSVDWIIAKDVLEHVPNVADVITEMMESAKQGVFAVVPLSMFDGQPYVVEAYEHDVTHLHRFSLATWFRLFARPGWSVDARYAIQGIKQNYAEFSVGNGFLTMRKL